MNAIHRLLVTVAFTSTGLQGCNHDGNAKEAFEALKRCAGSAMTPTDSILYMGPNDIPLGSIFQKQEDGGYDALIPGTDITGRLNDPRYADMVVIGVPGTCTFKGKSEFNLKLGLDVEVNPIPAGGEVSNDFKSSKVTSMSVKGFAWDQLYKAKYRGEINKKPGSDIYSEVRREERYASVAVLRVTGYQVKLQVNQADALRLKAKYKSGPLPKGLTGTIGAEVGLTWISDNELELTIDRPTYVGAVMRPFSSGELQAEGEQSGFGRGVGGAATRVTRNKVFRE